MRWIKPCAFIRCAATIGSSNWRLWHWKLPHDHPWRSGACYSLIMKKQSGSSRPWQACPICKFWLCLLFWCLVVCWVFCVLAGFFLLLAALVPVYMYLFDTTCFFSLDLQTKRRCNLLLRCRTTSAAASFQPEFACFRWALDRSEADSTSIIFFPM